MAAAVPSLAVGLGTASCLVSGQTECQWQEGHIVKFRTFRTPCYDGRSGHGRDLLYVCPKGGSFALPKLPKLQQLRFFGQNVTKLTDFRWDDSQVSLLQEKVFRKQGMLYGRLSSLGFDSKLRAMAENLTYDVVFSSEIEGIH